MKPKKETPLHINSFFFIQIKYTSELLLLYLRYVSKVNNLHILKHT